MIQFHKKIKRIIVLFMPLVFMVTIGNSWASSKGKATILKRVDVDDAYKPKVLGLFIGIQEYKDPLWHDLKYPKKDVEDMVNFFTENPTLKLDYKMVLTTAEETTRDSIFNHKLEEFEMKNSSDKDVVIVYISSHGTLTKELITVIENGEKRKEPRKVPYILTSDTQDAKVEDSALALFKITEWFEKLRSQRKVLILDMCHSGRFGKSQLSSSQATLIESEKGINYTPMEDSWASIILAACPIGGTSFEDKILGNSVYTHFLLEGMRLGDLNRDGAVSISEAHNYSIDKTRQYTWDHKKYKQVPTAYSKILGKDPIIVFGKPETKGNPTLFSYSSENQGVEVYLDGTYKGMLPKGIALEPGEHEIICKRDGEDIYRELLKVLPKHDYMLPPFQVKKYEEDKLYMFLEGGYRNFTNSEVPGSLIPNVPTAGFSLYRSGLITKWLGLSGGFDYGRNSDLEQYATRVGLKINKSLGQGQIFIGPDVMFMFFRYASNTIDGNRVDQEMSFSCPGADALFTYKFDMGLVTAVGARAYYMPYKTGSEIKSVLTSQVFITGGYSF